MRCVARAVVGAGLVLTCTGPAWAQVPTPGPPPTVPGALLERPCQPPRSSREDWAGLCRYQEANRQIAPPVRVVMTGDSITEFWLRTSPGFFAEGIVDRGISGQTCPQVLARFYQDVVLLRPKVVHILCGTNDIAGNTGATSIEEVANAVRAMADLARANGIAVVLGSVPPAGAFGWRPEMRPAGQIAVLNAWLRDFAKARGLGFADYHAAMADAAGAMKPGLSNDGVHPNAAGYAVMEPIARAAIDRADPPETL